MNWKDMQLIDDIIRDKTNSFAVGMVEYSSIQEFYEDVLNEFNRLTKVPDNLKEAARDYGIKGNANGVGGEDYANDLAIAFKAGAQWMKDQLTVK